MNRRGFLGALLGVGTAGAAVQASVPVADPTLQSGDVVSLPVQICASCGRHLFLEYTDRPFRVLATCGLCQKAWLLVLPPTPYEPAPFKLPHALR